MTTIPWQQHPKEEWNLMGPLPSMTECCVALVWATTADVGSWVPWLCHIQNIVSQYSPLLWFLHCFYPLFFEVSLALGASDTDVQYNFFLILKSNILINFLRISYTVFWLYSSPLLLFSVIPHLPIYSTLCPLKKKPIERPGLVTTHL